MVKKIRSSPTPSTRGCLDQRVVDGVRGVDAHQEHAERVASEAG